MGVECSVNEVKYMTEGEGSSVSKIEYVNRDRAMHSHTKL